MAFGCHPGRMTVARSVPKLSIIERVADDAERAAQRTPVAPILALGELPGPHLGGCVVERIGSAIHAILGADQHPALLQLRPRLLARAGKDGGEVRWEGPAVDTDGSGRDEHGIEREHAVAELVGARLGFDQSHGCRAGSSNLKAKLAANRYQVFTAPDHSRSSIIRLPR